jgi:hypothetical protein
LAALFDRLAEAAAAHDGETAAEGIAKIEAGLAASHRTPGQRPAND